MSNIEPIYEYDANGNLIHYRDIKGYESWHEYDAKGNRIRSWDNNGVERRWEYSTTDKNQVHYQDSDENKTDRIK